MLILSAALSLAPAALSLASIAAALSLAPRAAAQIHVAKDDAPLEPHGSPIPLVEPYTAVNPADADHIVIGTIAAPVAGDSPWHCAAFTSFDRAATWMRHDFEMERCIDPWIIFAEDGSVLFTGIEIESGFEGAERFHLVAFESREGGRTWSEAPFSLGRTHDHELLTVDRASGAIYITSQRTHPGRHPHVYVGRLAADGHQLDDIAELGTDTLSSKPTGIAVDHDGSLIVTFEEYHPIEDSAHVSHVRAVRLASGRPEGPFTLTDGCDIGKSGFPGYPFLAVDASDGPQHGRLYHACVLPDLGGVGIAHSDTGGRSWSRMIRADRATDSDSSARRPDSATQAPVSGKTSPAELSMLATLENGHPHVRTPMLAVNSEGVVGVAWYDRRNDPEKMCQDVYFTASFDGAETFLPPRRISTETSCPNAPGNGRAARSWPMGGDYSSLAAGPDGAFHLVWADSRTGHFQLRHVEIGVGE